MNKTFTVIHCALSKERERGDVCLITIRRPTFRIIAKTPFRKISKTEFDIALIGKIEKYTNTKMPIGKISRAAHYVPLWRHSSKAEQTTAIRIVWEINTNVTKIVWGFNNVIIVWEDKTARLTRLTRYIMCKIMISYNNNVLDPKLYTFTWYWNNILVIFLILTYRNINVENPRE